MLDEKITDIARRMTEIQFKERRDAVGIEIGMTLGKLNMRGLLHGGAAVQQVQELCARRHLRAEIECISPRAICFLGETNAAPAAKELFGPEVGSEPREARLGGWTGLVAVSPQPVRNNTNRMRAKRILDRLPVLD